MYKIKLLILLLISTFLLSCSKPHMANNIKFDVAYIGGEYDGLVFKNYLIGHLKSFNLFDSESTFEIKSNIIHDISIYITNIDNTSDRENITTTINYVVYDKIKDCLIYSDDYSVSQFYIYASSDKYLSNRNAIKKIKNDNTFILVQKLINEIIGIEPSCNE